MTTTLSQSPTRTTSLVKLFCPLCGLRALTEKDGPGLYRVSCGRCRHAAIVQLASNVITPAPKGSLDRTCPRCGHVHQGSSECGQEMGPGRICRCEMEVTA